MPGLRRTAIYLLYLTHFLVILTLILGGYTIFTRHPLAPTFSRLGVNYGRIALTLLALTVLPGILGRFNLTTKPTAFIISIRRQFGVTVFWLAYAHYSLVRQFSRLSSDLPFFPLPLFEIFGTAALSLLFLMWLTSNNFSVSHLSRWWKRLHRVVYVILWLVFFHTAIQRISAWSILIGIIAILEVTSWIYYFLKPKTTTPISD